jgi:hypothetical protein
MRKADISKTKQETLPSHRRQGKMKRREKNEKRESHQTQIMLNCPPMMVNE